MFIIIIITYAVKLTQPIIVTR